MFTKIVYDWCQKVWCRQTKRLNNFDTTCAPVLNLIVCHTDSNVGMPFKVSLHIFCLKSILALITKEFVGSKMIWKVCEVPRVSRKETERYSEVQGWNFKGRGHLLEIVHPSETDYSKWGIRRVNRVILRVHQDLGSQLRSLSIISSFMLF